MTNAKKIGILAQDYILIAFIYKRTKNYIYFIIYSFSYINALILLNINPINYTYCDDDIKYQNENYIIIIAYITNILYKNLLNKKNLKAKNIIC